MVQQNPSRGQTGVSNSGPFKGEFEKPTNYSMSSIYSSAKVVQQTERSEGEQRRQCEGESAVCMLWLGIKMPSFYSLRSQHFTVCKKSSPSPHSALRELKESRSHGLALHNPSTGCGILSECPLHAFSFFFFFESSSE